MKVVILCGGLGTRLREETEYRPKPMVEIGGRPILWHIMKTYAWHGFDEFVLCLGYRGNVIKDYFLNYKAMNADFTISLSQTKDIAYHNGHSEEHFKVTLADTGQETMTGGRVRRVGKYITDDLFMLTYGDGVSNIDIGRLIEFHRSHGKLATLTMVRPQSRYGVVSVNESSEVMRFSEKPQSDGWVSAGYFVLNRAVIDYIDSDDCIFEAAPAERLAREGQLMAYRHDGFFYAMDTYREYKYLNDLWASGEAPWKVWR